VARLVNKSSLLRFDENTEIHLKIISWIFFKSEIKMSIANRLTVADIFIFFFFLNVSHANITSRNVPFQVSSTITTHRVAKLVLLSDSSHPARQRITKVLTIT